MRHRFAFAAAVLSLIFAAAPAPAQQPNQDGYYGQSQNWRGALSPDDQRKFDDNYSKWVDSQRKNDHDDIVESARHMQDIMSRNNIPTNVPFDQIASSPVSDYAPPQSPYNNGAYPNGAYAVPAQARLSPDDQRKFDEDYSKWVESQRKNDRDDIAKSADRMQQIMSRNGIPANVPFAAIATNGGYVATPNAPYGYPQSAPRLSAKDQSDFDKYYHHWVDARHKHDMDDVDKNARKMQEIMVRYNIPANVQFDQIASAGYR